MINSTFGGFMTARQGMAASQHGLNLTGHNLTNSATEGYTRQRIDQVSLNFNGTYRYASPYNVNVGNGVLVTGTSQLRDPFLDLRYRNEVAHVGEQGIKLEVLGDLQSILDEVKNAGDDTLGDGGIFNQLGDVLAKLQQLSNEVGNKEFDNMVKSSCQSLVTLFQSYDKRIQEVENNLAYDLENVDIPRVNDILKSIRELNKTIKSNEIMGNSALELKDQRNLLIDELSNYMKINVSYKPVQVSASTVVDELTIYMVGSDGNKYALVADEQCREFQLCDQCCTGPGNYNLSLSALSPVDTELKANLQTAINQLEKATQNADDATLKENYNNAAKAYEPVQTKWTELNAALDKLKTGAGGLQELTNAAETAETTFNHSDAALTTAKDTLKAALETQKNAEKTLAEKQAALDALAADAPAAEKTAAEKAVADATAAVTEATTKATEAQKAADEAAEKREAAKEAWSEAKAAVRAKEREISPAQAAVDNYRQTYNKAKEAYQTAVDALPADTTKVETILGGKYTDLITNAPLVGKGTAEVDKQKAQEKYDAALEALAISEENGKAIGSINNLLLDGSLKGTLEMLNYSGEYDNPPNTIRGVGYYQQALDTLAYEFATRMNEANNPAGVVQKDGNGDPIYLKDEKGDPIPLKDKNGKPIEKTDENGKPVLDAAGKPVLVYATNYNLFASTDGQKIDAGNITIANGWIKNEYSITASMKADASSGSNDNILHMISMFGEKFSFKASEDLLGKTTLSSNNINADAIGDTINGLKPGDTITIDGKTFTYTEGATGANGTEFDATKLETLETAAKKQGFEVSVNKTTGEITAKTATLDMKTLVTVNENQISNLADINVNKLTYGDTITIDGKTFTYKPNAETEADGTTDKTGDRVFKDMTSLIKEAEKENISIATDPANPNTITGITKTVGETITADRITVDKAPNIKDLGNGGTITIDNGKSPAVSLTYTGDIAKLIEDAAAEGIDLRIDEDTGEITSATQVGSNLFNGTFEEYFTNIGSILGLDIQATTEMLDNYSQLASTIAQNREAVTGVSLDEEAMNIMRYQQSYNASARLMTALDEMLTTLISNTGVAGR